MLRRTFRNFARLARGRGVAAVLELLTVAILARSLSPTDFGQIEQRPPAFSALRSEGKRAYEQARRGETVVLLGDERDLSD